jgi:hypothetical protein
MPNVTKFPLADIEDRLVNIRCLLNFGLACIEGETNEQFTSMKSDFCTMFYLLKDQIAGLENDAAIMLRREPLSALARK